MEYIRYLNLPKIPSEIIEELPNDLAKYDYLFSKGNYSNSNSFNSKILKWCNDNISPAIEWRFQFVHGYLSKHIDVNSVNSKFLYVYDQGGNNVKTQFWSDDGKKILAEYTIELNKWCMIKVNTLHSVAGVEPGLVRKAITGCIF